MPINLQTLFQQGDYKAGGVSPLRGMKGSSEDSLSAKVAAERLLLDKEKWQTEKRKEELGIQTEQAKVDDEALIDQTLSKYTTVNPNTNEVIVDHKRVVGELSAINSSAAALYRERLTKDVEADTKEIEYITKKQQFSTQYTLSAMEKAIAGDSIGASEDMTRVMEIRGVKDPTASIEIDPSNKNRAIIKTAEAEQEVNVKDYLRAATDANIKFAHDAQMEQIRLTASLRDTGASIPEHVRKYAASSKIDVWNRRLASGESPETISADIGYISESELADASDVRNLITPSKFFGSAAQNPELANMFNTEASMESSKKIADAIYKQQISSILSNPSALEPSIRSKYITIVRKAKK